MDRVIIIALLLAATSVQAATYRLTWTNPTQYTDGTLLPIENLTAIKIYCGPQSTLMASVPPMPATTMIELTGPYDCYATATDINGKESLKSNTITLSVRPKPPTQLKRTPL